MSASCCGVSEGWALFRRRGPRKGQCPAAARAPCLGPGSGFFWRLRPLDPRRFLGIKGLTSWPLKDRVLMIIRGEAADSSQYIYIYIKQMPASRYCAGKPHFLHSPDLKDALATDAGGCCHLASSLERPPPRQEIRGSRPPSEQLREPVIYIYTVGQKSI